MASGTGGTEGSGTQAVFGCSVHPILVHFRVSNADGLVIKFESASSSESKCLAKSPEGGSGRRAKVVQVTTVPLYSNATAETVTILVDMESGIANDEHALTLQMGSRFGPVSFECHIVVSDPWLMYLPSRIALDEPKDVVITSECDTLSLPCHWSVLMRASSYFLRMYASGCGEATSGRIRMPESPPVIQSIVNYAYRDSVAAIAPGADLIELYAAAEKYDMPELKVIVAASIPPNDFAVCLAMAEEVYRSPSPTMIRIYILKKMKTMLRGEEAWKVFGDAVDGLSPQLLAGIARCWASSR